MPPFKIENPWGNRENQEKKDKNQSTVDLSTQKVWNVFSDKPEYLAKLEKVQDQILANLDSQTKSELQTKCLAELKKVKFLDLLFLKTKLLAGLPTLNHQEEVCYGQLYCLVKISSLDNTEVTSDQILQQIDHLWDLNYPKFGNSRAVRNKNPGNLRMKGDVGKDEDWFAVFSTLEAGWSAFTSMISKWQTGMSKIYKPTFTLIQWAKRYDPSNPHYATKLAQYLWVSIKTQLKDIASDTLAAAIVHHEDGKCYNALKAKGIIK